MQRLVTRITATLVISGFFLGFSPCASQTRIGFELGKRDDASARARAGLKLAKNLVGILPRLLEDFRARRQKLLASGGGDGYPRDGLAKLLDSTEASLKKELRKDELLPVRNYVESVFDEARGDLGLSSSTAFIPTPAPRAVLASLQPSSVEPAASASLLDRNDVDPILDQLTAFVTDLLDRAKKNGMTVDLCLVSEPKGAKVSMKAKGSREVYKRKTSGPLQHLFRGRYFYTVEGKGFKIRCETQDCQINIYDKAQPVLVCQKGERDCDLEEGWQEICHGR